MSALRRDGAAAVAPSGAVTALVVNRPANAAVRNGSAPSTSVATAHPIGDYRAFVKRGLQRAAAAAARQPGAEGLPGTQAEGQLIRPLVALASASRPLDPPNGFWFGALAIQLAHEASLVHDDILDGASERRGEPTVFAAGGVARALVMGDHLLTAAYRAAAATGSLEFVTLFARSVERTVAGEAAQGRAAGRTLDAARYEEIALGKAGELLGCALALAPLLEERSDAAELFQLGRRIGLLYQRLDDLLDYCPGAVTGKPVLGDFAQRRWTWVLEECPDIGLGGDVAAALDMLHRQGPSGSPMRRCLVRLTSEAERLTDVLHQRLPADPFLGSLIGEWITVARRAVEGEERQARRRGAAAVLRRRIPVLARAEQYLAEHSRSFRFASRFFPAADADRVARVYAFCRVTDDLVDRPGEGQETESLLESWLDLAREAYHGKASGLPLLDRGMTEMASAAVPFAYACELVEGMRMDLRGERYASTVELRRYTYRVAAVVGLWMTRLFGVHDSAVLGRAERMGHAMQLTNILRDVGEDWARGRLYLPADLMEEHGVTEGEIDRMYQGGAISAAYEDLVEGMLRSAEADYASAMEAIPALPGKMGRPVVVAAHVYRGIHQEIRRNGYDNLRRRAYTSPVAKGVLAARGLWDLRRTSRPPLRFTALGVEGPPEGKRD